MSRVEDYSSLKPPDQQWLYAAHDGIVHNPLGAAAYVFEKELAKPILRYLGLVPEAARFPQLSPSSPSEKHNPDDDDALTEPPSPISDTFTDADSAVSFTQDHTSATLTIHIGAQPNNSPHAGTIVTFTLAFLLARLLQAEYRKLRTLAFSSPSLSPAAECAPGWVDDLHVLVQLDLVDTAPDAALTTTRDARIYQRSHRATGAMHSYLPDYHALLDELSAFVDGEVKHAITYQDALMRSPAMRDALRAIIRDRARIAPELAPQRSALAIRAACPVEGCGLADKHGLGNIYAITPDDDNDGHGLKGQTTVTFHCPDHGAYALVLEDPDDRAQIELNTPLRNLARALVYAADTAASRVPARGAPRRVHMRVTGADYAGLYQETLFHRQLARLHTQSARAQQPLDLPLVFYAPLITDWSGAKLSKSLYVKEGAYHYLDATDEKGNAGMGMGYLLEYARMVREGRDRTVLFRMVEDWVREPKKLFRGYSIYYVHARFGVEEMPKAERAVPDSS